MIGVDPHKGSHTAVAVGPGEGPLGQVRVRASAVQAERLLEWSAAWPERTWAVEGAGGLGHLLAQQLLAAGERVLDVQPKLAARVRLLATGAVSKNDPNDAYAVAVAALRSPSCPPARPDDHAAVLKIWAKRYRDLGRSRTQAACRLHAVLCELVPGGSGKEISAGQAERILEEAVPCGAAGQARQDLAAELISDLRQLDARISRTRKKLDTAVLASGTSLTRIFGVGSFIAAVVIGDVRDVTRFPDRDRFAAYNGTAPIEVSSGPRTIYRLSRRGNRRLNHAIHMAAVTQVRHRHSPGRAYYNKKIAEGKTPKEALRCLKRQVSNAIFACLQADARRAAARAGDPGGQRGNDCSASAAGLHPRNRLFGQATPGPGHHTTTAAAGPVPAPARQPRGAGGHSSTAAGSPPAAKARVTVERPQRSEDERPGRGTRRRPHSAPRRPRRKPTQPLDTKRHRSESGVARTQRFSVRAELAGPGSGSELAWSLKELVKAGQAGAELGGVVQVPGEADLGIPDGEGAAGQFPAGGLAVGVPGDAHGFLAFEVPVPAAAAWAPGRPAREPGPVTACSDASRPWVMSHPRKYPNPSSADEAVCDEHPANDQVGKRGRHLAAGFEAGRYVLLHGESNVRVAGALGELLPADLGVTAPSPVPLPQHPPAPRRARCWRRRWPRGLVAARRTSPGTMPSRRRGGGPRWRRARPGRGRG